MSKFFIAAVIVGVGLVAWYGLERGSFSGMHPAASRSSYTYTYANASEDSIFVTSPHPGDSVKQSIVISGFARGNWYFEAVFPAQVLSSNGAVIGSGQGRAGSDWMTENFVPFTATVDLTAAYIGPATIILKKDNPSGDSSQDASLSFPIIIQ